MIERETTIAEVRAIAADRTVLAAHVQRDGVCVICRVAMCWPRAMAIRSLIACGDLDQLSLPRPHTSSPG